MLKPKPLNRALDALLIYSNMYRFQIGLFGHSVARLLNREVSVGLRVRV